MKLPCSDEGVVVPRPAVFLEQLADLGIVEFEARVAELALLIDARAGALQIPRRGDHSVVDEVRRLREVPTRPHHTYCEILGANLVAPFDPPPSACRIPDRHAWLRAGSVLLQEVKWGSWCTRESTWSVEEIEGRDVTRVAPDLVP